MARFAACRSSSVLSRDVLSRCGGGLRRWGHMTVTRPSSPVSRSSPGKPIARDTLLTEFDGLHQLIGGGVCLFDPLDDAVRLG